MQGEWGVHCLPGSASAVSSPSAPQQQHIDQRASTANSRNALATVREAGMRRSKQVKDKTRVERTVAGHLEQRRDLAARLLPVRIAVQRQRCNHRQTIRSVVERGAERSTRDAGQASKWMPCGRRRQRSARSDGQQRAQQQQAHSSDGAEQRLQQMQAKARRTSPLTDGGVVDETAAAGRVGRRGFHCASTTRTRKRTCGSQSGGNSGQGGLAQHHDAATRKQRAERQPNMRGQHAERRSRSTRHTRERRMRPTFLHALGRVAAEQRQRELVAQRRLHQLALVGNGHLRQTQPSQ